RRLAQLCDRRVERRERAVGVGGVAHAVALRADQDDVLAGAALLPRHAVVLGQLRSGEQPATEATIKRVVHARYHFGPLPSLDESRGSGGRFAGMLLALRAGYNRLRRHPRRFAMRAYLFALFLLLFLSGAGLAAPEAPDAAEIEKWIGQLGDDNPARRQE